MPDAKNAGRNRSRAAIVIALLGMVTLSLALMPGDGPRDGTRDGLTRNLPPTPTTATVPAPAVVVGQPPSEEPAAAADTPGTPDRSAEEARESPQATSPIPVARGAVSEATAKPPPPAAPAAGARIPGLRSPWVRPPHGRQWHASALQLLMQFQDVPGGKAYGKKFLSAFKAARKRDKCALPITCQLNECTPASLAEDAPCEQYELPPLAPELEAMAKVVVLEVGTNLKPESTKLAPRPDRMLVAVEPLMAEGTVVWGRGLTHVLVSSAVGPTRQQAGITVSEGMSAVELNPAAVASGRGKAGKSVQRTPITPASEIIARYVPKDALFQFMVTDVQGFDVSVALSAGGELKRLRYLVMECQEAWPDWPRRIHPTAPTCSEALAEVVNHTGFRVAGCIENIARFEYNCLMVNPTLERVVRHLPPYEKPETTTPLRPDWRDALNVTEQPALEQLSALLGPEEGEDAYHLLCWKTIEKPEDEARRDCIIQSPTEIVREMPRRACRRWSVLCSVFHIGAREISKCFKAREKRCTGEFEGVCASVMATCKGEAGCIEKTAKTKVCKREILQTPPPRPSG